MAFEDLLRKVSRDKLDFVKVAGADAQVVPVPGPDPEVLPVGPSTVIRDDIGFVRTG
jgi:hypothetical protein